jgi:hypothetical protein
MYMKSATWEGAAWVTTRSSPARSGRWLEHSRSNALNVELRAGSPAASRRGEASTTHTRHVESVHTVKPWPKPCLPHTDQNTPDHAHKPRTGAFISVHLHAPPLDVVVAHAACRPSEAILEALGGLSMQDPANELRRITLLRGWVNRPQEGGRRKCGGVSVLRYSSSSGVEARPSISLRCGWRPKRAITSRAPLA